jgi:hypothetical protein
LPAKVRISVEQEGCEKNKGVLGLRRHALERRDIGYAAFMQNNFSFRLNLAF